MRTARQDRTPTHKHIHMEYNSTRPRLLMPEYGRLVQQMADRALAIKNRQARQAYAESIVSIMATLSAQPKGTAGYKQKLWDHLAYITHYQLDIDYPCEINVVKPERKPGRMPYPGGKIRHRHYGRLLETLVEKLKDMPEGNERDELVRMAGNRMKRNLADWKDAGFDDQMVAHDLAAYTDGIIKPDFSTRKLAYIPEGGNAGMEKGKHGRKYY